MVLRDGSGVQMPPRKIIPLEHEPLGDSEHNGPLNQHLLPVGFCVAAIGPASPLRMDTLQGDSGAQFNTLENVHTKKSRKLYLKKRYSSAGFTIMQFWS